MIDPVRRDGVAARRYRAKVHTIPTSPHHFGVDLPAVADLVRQAVARQRELEHLARETMSGAGP